MLKKEKKINIFCCDKCGKEYERTEELGEKPYNTAVADGEGYDYFGRLPGELVLFKVSTESEDNIYIEERVDLCPDCYTILEEWLGGESHGKD